MRTKKIFEDDFCFSHVKTKVHKQIGEACISSGTSNDIIKPNQMSAL